MTLSSGLVSRACDLIRLGCRSGTWEPTPRGTRISAGERIPSVAVSSRWPRMRPWILRGRPPAHGGTKRRSRVSRLGGGFARGFDGNQNMKTFVMNKSSREIGLVLVSSTLILVGCGRDSDDEDEEPTAPAAGGTSPVVRPIGGVGRGFFPMSGPIGTTGRGGQAGGSSAETGSARGGFGTAGHAAGAGE